MELDTNIKEIVDRALNGKEITVPEIKELFTVPAVSEESYFIQYASRKMSEVTLEGKAEVHAQVGINVGPCPKNCQFCSFAATNRVFKHFKVLTPEEIIKRCQRFEQDGANAIYLMATANFKFEEFINIAKQVKPALKPETVFIANVGDFDEAGALALKEAGFTGVYHAIRLGEGTVTDIDPKERLKTVRAAKKAGLLVGTCVEPVGPEHALEELVEKTRLVREMAPVFGGAARRIPIPGTELAKKGMVSEARMAHILAVVRLAMGYRVPGNCTHEPNGIGAMAGASLLWAENGSNPRDTDEKTETNRGYSVKKCREILSEAGWDILDGPSQIFKPQCR
jgi:biotin synthase